MNSANSYVNRLGHYADLVLFALALRIFFTTKFKSYFLKPFYIGKHKAIHSDNDYLSTVLNGFRISKAK